MKKILAILLIFFISLNSFGFIPTYAENNPSEWANNEIIAAKNANLITKKTQENYQSSITREEFCELAMKLYTKLTNQNITVSKNPFNDTTNTDVVNAYSLGIVNGISNNEFDPYSPISRQEICVMLTRLIHIAIDGSDTDAFSDINFEDEKYIDDWALDSVKYAYSHEIIKGVGNNTFDPLGNTTCEQAIILNYRIYENKDHFIAYDTITNTDCEDLLSVRNAVIDSIKKQTNSRTDIETDSIDDAINTVANLAESMKEKHEILNYSKDTTTVWMQLNSGIQYVFVPQISDYDFGETDISISTYQPFSSYYAVNRPNSGGVERGIEATDESARKIANELGNYKFTNNYDNDNVTAELLKKINRNQFILWHGHGGYNSKTHSFLGTGEKYINVDTKPNSIDYEKLLSYQSDILSGRIILLSTGVLAVTPDFFTKHLSDISDTFIYLGTCESAHDNILANSFLRKGAIAIIGNTAKILTTYNQNMIKSVCDGLLIKNQETNAYQTLSQALNYAKSLHGKNDGGTFSAEPIIYGDTSMRLIPYNEEVINTELLSCIGKTKDEISSIYGPVDKQTDMLGSVFYRHKNLDSDFAYDGIKDYPDPNQNGYKKCTSIFATINDLFLGEYNTLTIDELSEFFGDYKKIPYDGPIGEYAYSYNYKDYTIFAVLNYANLQIFNVTISKDSDIYEKDETCYNLLVDYCNSLTENKFPLQANPYNNIKYDNELTYNTIETIDSYQGIDLDGDGIRELVVYAQPALSEEIISAYGTYSCFIILKYTNDGIKTILATSCRSSRGSHQYFIVNYYGKLCVLEAMGEHSSAGNSGERNIYSLNGNDLIEEFSCFYSRWNNSDDYCTLNGQEVSYETAKAGSDSINEVINDNIYFSLSNK